MKTKAIRVLALALALAGCGQAASRLPAQTIASPTARVVGGAPGHLAVIVMENEEYSAVAGSRAAPYTNGLASDYALAARSYAISHPSLPNYLALTGGSTFGINSDCTDCAVRGSGIIGQLESRRLSWKAYMEDLPHSCFTGSGTADYAKKHDPFVYYEGIVHDPRRCSRVVPMTQLAADERAGRLPRFIWITPNLCHDMHDCDTATGDRFLSRLVPPLLRALGPHGLLILTWDEGSTDGGCCRLAGGGHVVTILAGADARRHAKLRTPVDHYSVLQTIEDLFRLRRRAGAACSCTPSLQQLLRGR
jgi:phosphatidylinositol-3-phosphatase